MYALHITDNGCVSRRAFETSLENFRPGNIMTKLDLAVGRRRRVRGVNRCAGGGARRFFFAVSAFCFAGFSVRPSHLLKSLSVHP